MSGDSEGGRKAKETQIANYGGLAGYAAEMRRRAGLRKTHSGGIGTTEQYRERAKKGWQKRREKNISPQTGHD